MRENLALLSRQKLEDEAKKLVMEDDNTNLLKDLWSLWMLYWIFIQEVVFSIFCWCNIYIIYINCWSERLTVVLFIIFYVWMVLFSMELVPPGSFPNRTWMVDNHKLGGTEMRTKSYPWIVAREGREVAILSRFHLDMITQYWFFKKHH